MEKLKRVLHQPERYEGNPILEGTQPWEKWKVSLNGRSVLYDDEDRQFKMWYSSTLRDAQAPGGLRYKVCYATSEDGILWQRANLEQVEWEGSRANNIIRWGENWLRRPNVIKDEHDPDPNRRFKMIYADVMGGLDGPKGEAKAFSRDGIHWDMNVDGNPVFPRHNANLLGWDSRLERYVWYGRCGDPKIAVGRATSPDFLNWSWAEYETVLAPVTRRPDLDLLRRSKRAEVARHRSGWLEGAFPSR
jgi:hypothetical protein